jgi:2-haloacid dehalogenase
VWRQKQLEYTFRLTEPWSATKTSSGSTRKSLDYALAAEGRALEADQKDALVDQYNDLKRFPDVEPGLERLKEAGHTMVVFSNGTPHMLNALMDAAELRPYFQGVVSVDEAKAYKPSPKAYRHVAKRLERPIEEVRLVSSNSFDDIGAEAAGMRAAWVDRSGDLFETLGSPLEVIVGTLTELADALQTRRG